MTPPPPTRAARKGPVGASPSYSLTAPCPPSVPSRPGSSTLIYCPSESSLKKKRRRTRKKRVEQSRCQAIPIEFLPDEVLLQIFDFCRGVEFGVGSRLKESVEAWQTLVHVCRRWRSIVFGSTNRLGLTLVCTSRTLARNMLDEWPDLPRDVPLIIYDGAPLSEGLDNIIAALECSDRVLGVDLQNVGGSPMEEVLAAMQEPFPYLTKLVLRSNETVTFFPNWFLNGYAPNLQYLELYHIPIPGLPNLLSHSTKLSHLYLLGIPHSGYFSPEEIVTCLSSLTGLTRFVLNFESPLSRPERASRRRPPPPRSVLPVLKKLGFKGVSEYLEDLVARIDSPQLGQLDITFFNQIDFYTPQLVQFVSRTPVLKAFKKPCLAFGIDTAVSLSSMTNATIFCQRFNLKISCRELDWQVSSLEQLCTLFFPSIFTPEDIYIFKKYSSEPSWKDNVENALWLALLHSFATVKNLYLCKEFAPRIVPALQELIGGRTTEVLPTLQNIFLEGLEGLQTSRPFQKAIKTIVTARQVSGHPVAISKWSRDLKQEWYRDLSEEVYPISYYYG